MRKQKILILYFLPVLFFLFGLDCDKSLAGPASTRGGNSSMRGGDINLGYFSTQDFASHFTKGITLQASDANYNLSAEDLKKWTAEKEDLIINPKYNSEVENLDYCQYKKSIPCQLTLDRKSFYHAQKVSSITLNSALVADYLDNLAQQTDKNPQNATLQVANGKVSVFSLSSDGVKLDKEKSLQILLDYFKNNSSADTVSLAYDKIKPEVSIDSIDNLGIRSLIGEGRSNFAGSPQNRIHNINVGAQKFNGVLINPGEEFSFIKTLGPVDESTGYLPELVIKGDQTLPEFGGGMCQVSTTAFRAAVYAGLKITARTPHAYPVRYYNPQGMDATVYIPSPDLKFINNTPRHILIQTRIEGTQLIFDFFGTDDGRKINIIGPKITESNPDGSMKATFTQEVYDSGDQKIINAVFNSSYESPSKFPHPGEVLAEKPADWSQKQWKAYKKEHNL